MHVRAGLAATLAALALLSTHATAQRFYIGASGGGTRIDSGYAGQVARGHEEYSPGVFSQSDVRADSEGAAARVFAGWRLSDMFSIEIDYTRLGTIDASYTLRDVNPLTQGVGFGVWQTEFEARAYGVSLLAHAPIARDVSLFGRAGLSRTRLTQTLDSCFYRTNIEGSIGVPVPDPQACGVNSRGRIDETRPVAGLGIDWRVGGTFTVRASWDRYFGVGEPFNGDPRPANQALGEFDIDYFGIGATFSF